MHSCIHVCSAPPHGRDASSIRPAGEMSGNGTESVRLAFAAPIETATDQGERFYQRTNRFISTMPPAIQPSCHQIDNPSSHHAIMQSCNHIHCQSLQSSCNYAIMQSHIYRQSLQPSSHHAITLAILPAIMQSHTLSIPPAIQPSHWQSL